MKKICFAFVVPFLLVAIVHTAGCGSRKIPADFDYGHWSGSTYQNDFFGFSITVPEDWHIAGKENIADTMQKGQEADFISEKGKKALKSVDITVAVLLHVARYTNEATGAKEAFGPNFMLAAENFSSMRITWQKYVELNRQEIVKAVPGIVIKSETNGTIGGMEFTSLKTELNVNGIHFFQETLICLKNGFALNLTLCWSDDSEKEQLDAIMATLEWK